MKQIQVNKFLEKTLGKYLFFAPSKSADSLRVKKIESLKDIDWSGAMPDNSYKFLFLPIREEIFEYKNDKVLEKKESLAPTIVFGLNILDLQAFGLYELVFAKDPYYQKRRQANVVIGYSNGLEDDFRKYKSFHQKFEENILEHLSFDIFIEKQKNNNLKVFTGSEKGQKLLDDFGLSDYENIEFAGFIPEEGPDPQLLKLQEKVKNSFSDKVWEELNAKCLACGRCSVVCPTCFCYDLIDEPGLSGVTKIRQWSSCFYNDFSTMAPNHEILNTVKKKIYFWYFHKFVRIPEEFKYPGCVSCMRCWKVCPVDINIKKVLTSLNLPSAK
jgi:ferredoxin